MARFRHISTKMVLVLDAGTEEGKKIRKRVIIGNIREDASPDALWELAEALGKLLEHPVAKVLLYKEEAVEREDIDRAADENGDARNEADADNSRAAYSGVQNKGVTKNAGAEKDAGDDRGAGETRAGGGTALLAFASRRNGSIQPASNLLRRREPPFGRRGDGDCVRLRHWHAPAVYGKHAAMLGKRAAVHAALPSLQATEAENGRSPPARAGRPHRHSEEPQAMKYNDGLPSQVGDIINPTTLNARKVRFP